MKKRMKIVFVILVCSLFFSASGDAKEPIHIGLSAPMTGQYAGYGESFKNATDLAVKQINIAGGIDGRSVEVIVEDSQGNPKLAKRIARKFAKDERILAEIGDFTSTCSMAAAPIYQRAGMVQLSPTASHPSFAPGSPFCFSIFETQEGYGEEMARMALKRLGKKKLAVLYLNNDWGVVAKKFFVDAAKKLGADILAIEPYLEGTTDFTISLEKLRSLNPEILYVCSLYHEAALICKTRQSLGWKDIIIIGPGTLYNPKFIKLGGDAVENVFTMTSFFPEAPDPEIQKFVKAYKKKYESAPQIFEAVAYDAMSILAQAIEKGGTDRKALRDSLANTTDFSGVTGKITFTDHGSVRREGSILLHVKDSEFVVYSKKE